MAKVSNPRPTTLIAVDDNKLTKVKVDGNTQKSYPCPDCD